MPEQTVDRVSRLLAMVPYLLAHDGVHLDEAAEHFGVSRETFIADLHTLWFTGLPGYLPDDLIEVSWDDDIVHISNVHGIERPLRLGPREAMALLVGVRALSEVPDLGDTTIIESVQRKLTDAMGRAAEPPVDIHLDGQGRQWVKALRRAIKTHTRVRFAYTSATDQHSQRLVEPFQLVAIEQRWYLQAWCTSADGERMFRLDRISELRETDEPSQHTPEGGVDDRWPMRRADLLPASGDLVTVAFAGDVRDLTEHIPVETVTERSDGLVDVTLRVVDPQWFVRLLLRLGPRVVEARGPHAEEYLHTAARRARAAIDLYGRLDARGAAAGRQ